MIKDGIIALGDLEIVLCDAQGRVKEHRLEKNLVVNVGLAFIAQRMASTPTVMSHMAVGTGGTAAAAANTVLGTEVARVALTSASNTTTTVTNDSMQYVATFPAGTATAALTEAAILNAASAGTMLSRTVFAVVNKGASDAMTITWTIKVA